MNRSDLVYVAGHTGLVGAAIVRRLDRAGFANLLLRTDDQLDLTDIAVVRQFFASKLPDQVFLAAAPGGTGSEAVRRRLIMQRNVIDAAYRTAVRQVVLFGDVSVYPPATPQPLPEEALLVPAAPGPEPRAPALAGIDLCRAYERQGGTRYLYVIHPDLYGPGDSFDRAAGNTVSGLVRRLYEARELGDAQVLLPGAPGERGEFLHVDDLADACVFLAEARDVPLPINVGAGADITMHELAGRAAEIVGYPGRIVFEQPRSDVSPARVLGTNLLRSLGWAPRYDISAGITAVYRFFMESRSLIIGL